MKNLIIYSGIALVVMTNSGNTLFDKKTSVEISEASTKEIVVDKGLKTVLSHQNISNLKRDTSIKDATILNSKALLLRIFPKTTVNTTNTGDESIALVCGNKMNKTADELIAEDNAITENNISNETQALDFKIINKVSKSWK